MEVASFVSPLNQFEQGETAYACVAFGCADIYYSGPPGGQPTGTAEQIDQMADIWYTKMTGSLNSIAGLSLNQEWEMLTGIGLHWQQLSTDVTKVRDFIQAEKLPVLICGTETGFFDVGLGRVPYGWTPAGNHAIVACGVANSGNLLVRDYAASSFGATREYANSTMVLVSATAVTPRWKEPWGADSHQFVAAVAEWNTFIQVPYTTGIGAWWFEEYRNGHFHGGPLKAEESRTDWQGQKIAVQVFAGGKCEDLHGTKRWYPYS